MYTSVNGTETFNWTQFHEHQCNPVKYPATTDFYEVCKGLYCVTDEELHPTTIVCITLIEGMQKD